MDSARAPAAADESATARSARSLSPPAAAPSPEPPNSLVLSPVLSLDLRAGRSARFQHIRRFPLPVRHRRAIRSLPRFILREYVRTASEQDPDHIHPPPRRRMVQRSVP